MSDIDYSGWAKHISSIFEKYSMKPSLILDLGCGTGSMCVELAKKGFEMIGIDSSPEMLAQARQKAIDQDLDILYLNQDMTAFELYGTVDAVLCLLDSINYVLKPDLLKKTFSLVNNYLNPGGSFIFDINSEYKLEKILGNNVFYSIDDDIAYIWQNSFSKKKRICTFDLTFFVRSGMSYNRFDESHYEKAYNIEELEGYLSAAGLMVLDITDGMSFKKVKSTSERIVFTCKKPF